MLVKATYRLKTDEWTSFTVTF